MGRMKEITTAFMEARTISDIENLKFKYADELEENPALWKCVKNARKRINLIRKEVRKSFKTYEMN